MATRTTSPSASGYKDPSLTEEQSEMLSFVFDALLDPILYSSRTTKAYSPALFSHSLVPSSVLLPPFSAWFLSPLFISFLLSPSWVSSTPISVRRRATWILLLCILPRWSNMYMLLMSNHSFRKVFNPWRDSMKSWISLWIAAMWILTDSLVWML